MQVDPIVPVNTYHDSFGNFCHVIRAPAGRLTRRRQLSWPVSDNYLGR
jgi:hypothetical protein